MSTDAERDAPGATVAVGVVGAAECDVATEQVARHVGERVASAGALLVTGGLGGVMAAACRGAQGAGGTTLGLLPGDRKAPG